MSRPTYMWSGSEWVSVAPGIGAEGGVTDHQGLSGRSAVDQHPTSSITGLDASIAGKSDVGHSHPGVTIQAGTGIELVGVDPTVINNIDTGTDSMDTHLTAIDPHAGKYAADGHLHNGYANEVHTHDYSDPAHEHGGLYLPVAGGTMAGPLLLARTPIESMEATNRDWVLEQISLSGVELILDGTFDTVPDTGPAWDTTVKTAGAVSEIDPASPLDGNAGKTTLASPTDIGSWQQKSVLVPVQNSAGIKGYFDCAAAVGNINVSVMVLFTYDGSDPVYGAVETFLEEVTSVSINAGVTLIAQEWQFATPEGATKLRIGFRIKGDEDAAVSNSVGWIDNATARWESQGELDVQYGCSLFRLSNFAMTGALPVTWGSRLIDEGGFWHTDATLGSKGIKIPTGLGGLYRVTWACTFNGGVADTYRQHTLRLNGAFYSRARLITAGVADQYLEGNRTMRLNEGDYLDTQVTNAGATDPAFVGTENATGGNVFEAWKL